MHIVDLSHVISASMPVYPGTEGPRIRQATSIAGEGFAERLISMYSHTGTHIDAPGHILEEGATLDRFGAEHFVGPCLVIDVSGAAGRRIEREELQSYAREAKDCDFVLLKSGWSEFWGQAAYFEGFPLLSAEAAEWLGSCGLKGIGVDMISVDPVGSSDFSVHKILFRKNMVVVENLAGLEALDETGYSFCCMPLKLQEADGSPIRAFAFKS